MGLTCRCQKLPKGSPGRPCAKCKARNKVRNAKAKASGAHLKGVQKYQRTDKGRQVQRRAEQKYWRKRREAVAAARGQPNDFKEEEEAEQETEEKEEEKEVD